MEYLSPKIDGQGDGLKRITIRKRLPIDSSRKFNARAPRDDSQKPKLEQALIEMRTPRKIVSHCCIQKSKTVAEITPTKSKRKPQKILRTPDNDLNEDSSSDVTLFATPRPFDTCYLPSMCPRRKAVCQVYQRLMLCAWRRHRRRHNELTQTCLQQHNNLNQLELQIEVLNSLRNSESERRLEAVNDCHKMKSQIEQLEVENDDLKGKLKVTADALDDTKANLLLTKEDLQHCSEQLKRIQNQMKKKMEEKMDLVYKLTEMDRELQSKNFEVIHLVNKLKTAEMNLENTESNYKVKQEEISEVLENLQNEVCLNSSLKEEIEAIKVQNIELEEQARLFESDLHNYISACEQLTEENLTIKNDLSTINIELEEQKKRWYQKVNGPQVVDVIRRLGEIVLPIVSDRRVYY